MEFTIHGQAVQYNGLECGLYKQRDISWDYATMNAQDLVQAINKLPKDKAITAVEALKNLATQQASLSEAPRNLGYPILQGGPEPTPISEVRANIQNLETFTNDILKALKGE